MNIIILSPTKGISGGVERFSFYLQKSLGDFGHTTSIFGKEDVAGIFLIILKLSKYAGLYQPMLGYFLGKKALASNADIIITNGMLGWNIHGANCVNVQHGTFARAADRIDRNKNIFKWFIKRYVWGFFEGLAARRAATCVAVSNETRESVQKYYGVPNPIVIQNAVDTELFQPMNKAAARVSMKLTANGPIVIFVGRFEYAKGGKILEGVKEYLSRIGGLLIIAENYSQSELALLYNASDIFLLPSLHEGCSYALLDAMATGLPFLASPVGLVPELERAGLFTDCIIHGQNVVSYIERLEKILKYSDDERSSLTAQLRDYILRKHGIESFGKSYDMIIRSIS